MTSIARLGPPVTEEGGPVRDGSRAAALIADVTTCLVGVGMFVGIGLARSPQKLFWLDEVFTLVTVHDTTMGEMFASLKDTINAMPPAYFTCIWPWSRAFGTSELALRMFSCLCMCVAWFFCWRLLRTFCSRPAAATASLAGMFITKEILFNNIEARPYAMYLAAYMAASLSFVLSWGRAPSPRVAIGAFLAHATLVTTHYVGCLYSAALILSSLGGYVATRRTGLRSYTVGALLGSAVFVTCIPFYLAQRSLGGEDNWLPRPTWRDLAKFVLITYPYLKLLIVIVAGFYAATLLILHRARPRASAGRPDRVGDMGPSGAALDPIAVGLILLCTASFLMPIAIWAESRVGIRLFMGRYFLPSFVAWPCVLGLALEHLAVVSRREGPRVDGGAGSLVRAAPWACHGAVAVVALAFGIIRHQHMNDAADIKSVKHVSAAIRDRGLHFVTCDPSLFLPAWNYAGRPADRIRYLIPERMGNRGAASKAYMRIFGALERHFWPGVILAQGQLSTHRTRWLMLASERKTWVARGVLPEEFQVVEDLGDGLVVVEK